MSQFKQILISLFLATVLGLTGCASQKNYPAPESSRTERTPEQIDRNKIIRKKEGESDDMERLD